MRTSKRHFKNETDVVNNDSSAAGNTLLEIIKIPSNIARMTPILAESMYDKYNGLEIFSSNELFHYTSGCEV